SSRRWTPARSRGPDSGRARAAPAILGGARAERVCSPRSMVGEAARGLATEAWVREALEAAHALEALGEALAASGLARLPDDPGALRPFLEGPLLDALIGRVHPVTARAIVDELLARLAREAEERSS